MAADPAWRRLYPFASHRFVRDGVAQHYVDEGRGRPVLLVHGNPTWSFYWRNLIEPLRCRYRMVAVDHVGCGLSDKPQEYDYTLVRHIDNLVALVDQLDLHAATLVAHDWGGAIGLGAALARPTRFRSLVLFNTGAFPPPYIPWRIRACRLPWLGSWCVRRWNLFARAALHMAVARPERMTADVRAGLLAPYDTWEHRVAIERFVRDIPASPQHRTWQTLEQIERGLPQLAARPCLLIWGMRDWCFRPVCLERLMASFPSAEVHRLPHAAHYVVEDAYEEIVPILERFLAGSANAGDALPDGNALNTQGVGP